MLLVLSLYRNLKNKIHLLKIIKGYTSVGFKFVDF